MYGRHYGHYHRTFSVRRRRNWLAIGGRIGLVLWSVVLVVGLLMLPGSSRFPEVVQQGNVSGSAVAASVRASDDGLVRLNALSDMTEVRLPKATPVAYLNSTRFPIDGRGRLLAPEAAQRRRDLPVVTCEDAEVDLARHQVATAEVLDALQFLSVAQETSLSLFYRISQVAVDSKLGVVLYLESAGVPVLVGRGHMKRKVAYLATVLRHLDTEQGLAHVKFLDLRLQNQVVARMERAS